MAVSNSPGSQPTRIGRRDDLDIVKAFLIVAVVSTHSRLGISEFANWFELADFLILSGFFFRPSENLAGFKATVLRTLKHLFLPFIAWKIIMYLASIAILTDQRSALCSWSNFARCLLGGRMEGGDFFVVFWFIPVLGLTQITLSALTAVLPADRVLKIVTAFMFIAAGMTLFTQTTGQPLIFGLPVRLDVLFGAMFYFYVCGYCFFRPYGNQLLRPFPLFCQAAVLALIVIAHLTGQTRHTFYLIGQGSSGNVLYDIFIPFAALALLLRFARFLEFRMGPIKGLVTFAGRNTLIIMYAHAACGRLARKAYEWLAPPFPAQIGYVFYAVIGAVLLPLGLAWLIRQSRFGSRILLGEK